MTNVFDEAIKALEETIEYEKGNSKKGRSVVRESKTITPTKKSNEPKTPTDDCVE